MSQIAQFLQQIESDHSLKSKLASLETNEEILAFAQSLGFSFSIEDYTQALEEKINLDDVVGGAAMSTGVATCPYSNS